MRKREKEDDLRILFLLESFTALVMAHSDQNKKPKKRFSFSASVWKRESTISLEPHFLFLNIILHNNSTISLKLSLKVSSEKYIFVFFCRKKPEIEVKQFFLCFLANILCRHRIKTCKFKKKVKTRSDCVKIVLIKQVKQL